MFSASIAQNRAPCLVERGRPRVASRRGKGGRGPGGPGRAGARAHGKNKKPAASYSRTGGSRTTLGEGALDFRVRNGNGYGSSSMATGRKAVVRSQRESRRTGRRKVRLQVKSIKAKPHARLVPLGSTRRRACTCGLSRSSSTTALEAISGGWSRLRGGLALRCLQRLSVPGIATRHAAGATTGTPWARHSRSSRTRECSRQTTCAHRG